MKFFLFLKKVFYFLLLDKMRINKMNLALCVCMFLCLTLPLPLPLLQYSTIPDGFGPTCVAVLAPHDIFCAKSSTGNIIHIVVYPRPGKN